MPQDRFLIAPFDENSGLQNNLRPWLIPDQAFAELNNAYVFRGRVRKRFGSRWLNDDKFGTRLRIQVGVIAAGALVGNVRALIADAGMTPAVGQMFSAGPTSSFTVFNPNPGPQQMKRNDGFIAFPATYDLATSNFNITNTGLPNGTPVFFYPALPVMGLLTLEQSAINDEFIIGFDTRYAYRYVTGWTRLNLETTPGAAVWTGSNSQFFWGTTWVSANASDKIFFVTNYNQNEPNFMRSFNPLTLTWTNFRPKVSNLVIGPPLVLDIFLYSARLVVLFKNRLIFLNTWESESMDGITYVQRNYGNRARYSQVGSPLDIDAFRQDIKGKGNAIDCPTAEAIITAEFVKDRLIVYCERSTWELVYLGNQAYPFAWQQINTELGAESTFSIVPFDKVAIGTGNVGIHACNGGNVDRIDQKIPDEVFAFHNADQGVERVYGIRDYFVEMVYWTFPNLQDDATQPYPDRVLVYNYATGTWAFNDDSITVFGYLNQPNLLSTLWSSTTVGWDDDITWGSGSLQTQFRQVLGGNQEGYTFIVDSGETTNAAVLQITNIYTTPVTTLTVIDHNLKVGDFIYIFDATYDDMSNGLNNLIFKVTNVIDKDNFEILGIFTGVYTGDGVIARVSKISILTKEFNFYAKQGRNVSLSKVDFMVDRTPLEAQANLDVDFFVSTSAVSLLSAGLSNNTVFGNGTLETFAYPTVPFESDAARVIHPVYFETDGEFVQLQITMNDIQMTTVIPVDDGMGNVFYTGPTFVDFQMHFMLFYTQATSARFQ